MSDESPEGTASSLLDPIKRSFNAVFDEINAATEAWVNKAKLHTTGRDRYAAYISSKVGRFPLFGTTRQVQVQDLYVRVAFSNDLESLRYKPRRAIERSLYRQKRGQSAKRPEGAFLPPIEALNQSEGFALLGAPGSGKSTAFRHLAVLAANGVLMRGKRRIPVYLAAREMSKGTVSISAAGAAYFEDLGFEMPERLFKSLAESGSLLLLLDGIDETSHTHRASLLEELSDLRTRHPQALLCVSARPYSLSSGLDGFAKWETLPFSLEERLQFIERWFATVDPDKGMQLADVCSQRPALLDLGSSPLLLSIVCALYYNDLEIPEEPDELYDRALHGLLGQWDAFRNIARSTPLSGLSITKRFLLASEVAASLFSNGRIVFTVSELNETGAVQRCEERFRVAGLEPEQVVESLANDFGLLSERSPGEYSFSHLTFQEFLTAKYIVGHRTDLQLVQEFRKSARWTEVVELVAKLLPNADSFLDALHAVAKLGNRTHVITLLNVWYLGPVCSSGIQHKVMHGIATRVAAILKRLGADAKFRIEGAELTVFCKRHEPFSRMRAQHVKRLLAQADERDEEASDLARAHIRASAAGDDEILVGTLDYLLNLLRYSDMPNASLGVEGVRLFELWDESGRPWLDSIVYKDLSESPSDP